MRITEVNFHIRVHREGPVFGHLQSAVPGQRTPQGRGEFTNVPAQCGDDNSRILAGHLYQRGKTRMSFHQGHNVTVLCAADEITLPITGNGAVLDLCGSFPNGEGIDDSAAGLSAHTRVLGCRCLIDHPQSATDLAIDGPSVLSLRPSQKEISG